MIIWQGRWIYWLYDWTHCFRIDLLLCWSVAIVVRGALSPACPKATLSHTLSEICTLIGAFNSSSINLAFITEMAFYKSMNKYVLPIITTWCAKKEGKSILCHHPKRRAVIALRRLHDRLNTGQSMTTCSWIRTEWLWWTVKVEILGPADSFWLHRYCLRSHF